MAKKNSGVSEKIFALLLILITICSCSTKSPAPVSGGNPSNQGDAPVEPSATIPPPTPTVKRTSGSGELHVDRFMNTSTSNNGNFSHSVVGIVPFTIQFSQKQGVYQVKGSHQGSGRTEFNSPDCQCAATWVADLTVSGTLIPPGALIAEGPEGGTGYTIWIDEIKFEYRAGITNPQPSIPSQTLNLIAGESTATDNGTVTFDVDGSAVTVSAMPGYFDFQTSNASVASVNSSSQIVAVGGGTAAITATLGSTPATGTVTVNVTVPPDQPAGPAPTPTHDPADVIALFSDAYTTVTVDTWSASWDAADVEDFAVGLDNTKKYTNLVFAGIEFTSTTIDASGMTHFQMDVWTPDATAAPAVFRVKLVDFGANGVYDGGGDDVEHELTFDDNTMATGSWVRIDVPLSDFTSLVTREHLAQLIISGDPGTVYVDNVLLHR